MKVLPLPSLSHAGLELARSISDQACQWCREWATGNFLKPKETQELKMVDNKRYSKDTRATGGKKGTEASKILKQLNAPVIKVDVLQAIIEMSCRANSGHCMISDAVKVAAPWAKNIASDLQTIRLTDPQRGLRYTYLTPRIAQNALIEFDKGNDPEPFQFSLRGAHIATSYKRITLPNGQDKSVPIHKLGKRRLLPQVKSLGNKRGECIPDTVGGTFLPPTTGLPRATFRREYGMRAYTGQFDDAKKTGAPSISDK